MLETLRTRRLTFFHIVIAVILLVSAILKGRLLASEPLPPDSIIGSRWILLGVLEWEVVLAAWLCCGLGSHLAHRAAKITFFVFAAFATYEGVIGKTSCGCFGHVTVNPWITAVFDSAVFATLLITGKNLPSIVPQTPRHDYRIRAGVALLAGLALGAWLAVGVVRFQSQSLTDEGLLDVKQSVVVLETSGWIGKRCPLIPFINGGVDIGHGKWELLLYHHDCSECQKAVLYFEQLAPLFLQQDTRTILVEMSPYAEGEDVQDAVKAHCSLAQLDEKHEWFATTPVILSLSDARVESTAEGDAAVAFAEKLTETLAMGNDHRAYTPAAK